MNSSGGETGRASSRHPCTPLPLPLFEPMQGVESQACVGMGRESAFREEPGGAGQGLSLPMGLFLGKVVGLQPPLSMGGKESAMGSATV